LKDIRTDEEGSEAIDRLKTDAKDCKEKAKSASRRNLIIAVNAAFWVLLNYLVIPNINTVETNFDIYLDRLTTVLASLTINCSFYLIFSEWKLYICIFYHHNQQPKFTEASGSLLLAERTGDKHFLTRTSADKEVEYFASPALIYKDRKK